MIMHTALPPAHLDLIPSVDPLRWKQADDDVFVATLHDEYAGFVAVSDGAHALHGPQGQLIGSFATQREARAALRSHLLGPGPSAPATRSRASGRRRRARRLGRARVSG